MQFLCNITNSSYNCLILKPSNTKRMKNLLKFTLSLIAFLCLSQVVSAQAVNQGALMLGGSASFTSTSIKDVDGSNTDIRFNPNIGYFIADDLAIGLGLDVVNGNDNTDLGLGPFVRFYFADAIFVQANVGLGLGDNEFVDFEVGLGYSWFLNNSVAIEPKLFYRNHNVSDDNPFGFDSSVIGLSIGVQAFLNHDHGMEE